MTKKYNFMRYLILGVLLSLAIPQAIAQEKVVVDFSSRIHPMHKMIVKPKVRQTVAREYSEELKGTLIVTGYIDNGKVILSSIILETRSGEDATQAQRKANVICATQKDCSSVCGNKSDVESLICAAFCSIRCQ